MNTQSSTPYLQKIPADQQQEQQQQQQPQQRHHVVEDCRDYLRTGRCKYGASCKYNHPPNVQSGGGMKTPINPSEPMFPIRPNEPVCPYYMKHGMCKFGQACKFHHPPHTSLPSSATGTFFGGNTVLMNVGPSTTATTSTASSTSDHGASGSVPQQILLNTVSGDTVLQFLPQRPDEPNCTYFLKNGRCRYGAACRYHHPIQFHHARRPAATANTTATATTIDRRQFATTPLQIQLPSVTTTSEGTAVLPGSYHVQFVSPQQSHYSHPQQQQQQHHTVLPQHHQPQNPRGPAHVLVSDMHHPQPQRGPTHVLVSEAPITVMSFNNATSTTTAGSIYQTGPGLSEFEYCAPVGSANSFLAQERVSSSSSIASSYETAVSNLSTSMSTTATNTTANNGNISKGPPGRSMSSSSLNNTNSFGDTVVIPQHQIRPSNRVVIGTNGSDASLASRRHRTASFGSVGSSSEHSGGMSASGAYYQTYHHDGVVGWSSSGGSNSGTMPVHQEMYVTEDGSGSMQQAHESTRRQYAPYHANREVYENNMIREEHVMRAGQDRPSSGRRVISSPSQPMRSSHPRQAPVDGEVDHGLSMMTSALLNMLDSPEDNAAAKTYPSRISSSSTINNTVSPPSTPRSGHVNPPQDPNLMGDAQWMLPNAAGAAIGGNQSEQYYYNAEYDNSMDGRGGDMFYRNALTSSAVMASVPHEQRMGDVVHHFQHRRQFSPVDEDNNPDEGGWSSSSWPRAAPSRSSIAETPALDGSGASRRHTTSTSSRPMQAQQQQQQRGSDSASPQPSANVGLFLQ